MRLRIRTRQQQTQRDAWWRRVSARLITAKGAGQTLSMRSRLASHRIPHPSWSFPRHAESPVYVLAVPRPSPIFHLSPSVPRQYPCRARAACRWGGPTGEEEEGVGHARAASEGGEAGAVRRAHAPLGEAVRAGRRSGSCGEFRGPRARPPRAPAQRSKIKGRGPRSSPANTQVGPTQFPYPSPISTVPSGPRAGGAEGGGRRAALTLQPPTGAPPSQAVPGRATLCDFGKRPRARRAGARGARGPAGALFGADGEAARLLHALAGDPGDDRGRGPPRAPAAEGAREWGGWGAGIRTRLSAGVSIAGDSASGTRRSLQALARTRTEARKEEGEEERGKQAGGQARK
eukprot:gene15910-biopygen11826